MSNRPAGGARSKRWEPAPYDWYRESPRVVEQLMHAIDFADDLIWDPCCGAGNVLDVAKRYGHLTFGSDLIDRNPAHPFLQKSVFSFKEPPVALENLDRGLSLISNTPYSYQTEIAERIMTHALQNFGGFVRRWAFIVPIAFLASQDRWDSKRLLRWRPSHVCFYRERHTMPPGHLIDQMANPYEGGMADYAAIVFTRPHRWRTEAIWLPPGRFPDPPSRRTKAQGDDE